MIDFDKILTVTDAKRDLLGLVKKAHELSESIAITKNGIPSAVLIGMDEYEGLMETLEILGDSSAVKSIKKSLLQLENGKTVSHEEVWGK